MPFIRFLVSIPIIGRFIVVPVLELFSGKTRRMPNERGEVVPRKLLTGRILRAFFVLLAIAGFFLIYQVVANHSNNDSDTGVSTVDIGKTKGKFEEIVARSSDEDLVGLYRTLSFDVMDSLPEVNTKLKRRIRIAEKLLQSDSAEMRTEAVSFSLGSNLNLGMMFLRQKEPVPKSVVAELQKHLDSSAENDDPTVQALKSISKAVVMFSEFETPDSNSISNSTEPATLGAIADVIQQAAELSKNKIEAASILSQFVKNSSERLPKTETAFVNSVGQTLKAKFLDSDLEAVKKLGRSWNFRSIEQPLELPLIELTLPKEAQRPAVEANKKRLMEMLQGAESLEDKWKFIARKIAEISQAGHNDTAKELVDICKEKITDKNPDGIRGKILRLSQWLDHLNQEFDYQDLKDVFGNQVGFQEKTLPIRIIIYSTLSQKDELARQVQTLAKMATRSLMASKTASLTVIYINDGKNDPTIANDMKFAEDSESFNFWVINPKSPSGARHLKKYPEVDYPFIVLLDEDLKILSVSPDVYEYERQLIAAHKRERANASPTK